MNLKKVMAIGIALSIVTGSGASAFAEDANTATTLENFRKALQEQKEREMVLDSQLAEESNLQGLKDSDVVRVIVELEGEAVIEKATAKGVKVSDISKSEVESLQKGILKDQASVQSKIKAKGIKFEIINSFTNVTNGFSMSTTLEGAKKLETIQGVKSVTIANEYERPEPDMNNSGDITETPVAWANGYTGEGTVISIIDTGVDPSHKDMVLTDGSKAELDKAEVEGVVSEKSLPGKYYTEKVPYGYNYMDENNQILDIGPDASEHGMHVAGIAGANGDVENGGIKGTAPEAQILAMKVFGNNPAMSSTFGDVIIKAIDDSVILGADVINMSLGSTASFVDDNDPEQAAVNRAVDNGVVVAVSAGNSGTFGAGYDNPYAENPDYGVVGSPGLATKSIQVASIENNITTGDGIEFTVNGEGKIYPYTTAGEDILTVLKGQQLKAVDCGLGGLPEHFPAAVKGNVALIERGTYDFASKITNAEKAGAIAVIVYNNAANGDALLNMAYPEGCKIPAIFMGHSGGVLIKENEKLDGFTVSFNGKATSAHNPTAGKMADSSSWGTTPDLEFKPEITGVGGNVWSLAQNNGYRNMSGTSMASPNVAGGSALVLQRVDKLFDLTGEARVQMAKNILMSTALPHEDKGGNQEMFGENVNYTSPRRQGAGVMNLAGATETNAIVTDNSTGISKVNLKEINGDIATFTITVENFGDKELTYNLGGTVQTDLAYKGNTLLEADNIVDATTGKFPIGFNSDTVTVAPKSTKDIMVRVDLSNAVSAAWGQPISELFVNGGYVEGFVTLTSADDSVPELSIPYVGFKGEWDKAPILDASIYDKDRDTFYGSTAMMSSTKTPGSFSYLGLSYDAEELSEADGNFIDISPDGDGYSDDIVPMVSFLRNSKEVVVEILNSEGKVIRTLDKIENARKHYYDGGKNVRSFLNDAQWDGTVNNKVVADGTYTYRIRTKVDYKGAEWQNFDYKINVDLTAPELKNTSVDDNKKTLTMVGEDNFEGHVYAYVLSTPLDMYINSTGVFDISKELAAGYTMKDFEAGVSDYAQNMSVYDLGLPIGAVPGDKDAPVVKLASPEFFGNSNSNTVNFAGTVTDKSAVELVKINGEEVPLTYNKKTGAYDFSVNVNIENGYHSVKVYSKDAAGNELEFAHKLFVDAEPPVLNLEELPAQTTEGSVFIKGTATDNFPDLKIFVNGNLVEKIVGEWEYFDQQKPASYTFDNYEVALVDGENTI
ncbi:MAG: S8 family serine peptidase, partial [Clostridium sp.]